jgi:hypothetical protein
MLNIQAHIPHPEAEFAAFVNRYSSFFTVK